MSNSPEHVEGLCSFKNDCLSEVQLDGYHLGFLSESEITKVTERIAVCTRCQARQAEREVQYHALESAPDFSAMLESGFQRVEAATAVESSEAKEVASVQDESSSRPSWSDTFLWMSRLAFGATALVALLWVGQSQWFGPSSSGTNSSNSTGVQVQPKAISKGGSCFNFKFLHKKPGQSFSKVTEEGAVLPPKTLIQFDVEVYKHCKSLQVMVLGVEQTGAISVYVPLGKEHSFGLNTGDNLLPKEGALQLDSTQGLERIFVVASASKFSAESVRKALKQSLANNKGKLETLVAIKGWKDTKTLLFKKHP